MKIIGIENMTGPELANELDRGGRFVIYKYTFSVIVMTFTQVSDVHFLRGGEGGVGKGLVYSVMTFLFGWWGIPWGPISSIGSLWTNFNGGKIVTGEVLAALQANTPPPIPSAT